MATLPLTRGVFQLEHDEETTGAALATNVYVLDPNSQNILVKCEFAAAAANGVTCAMVCRRIHGDLAQTAEAGTSTNNDTLTAGVTQASATHGNVVVFPRQGAGSFAIDIIAGPASGAVDVWVGCD